MPTTAYSDSSGGRRLVLSYCLFADILGYKHTIESAITDDREEDEFRRYSDCILTLIDDVIAVPRDEKYQKGRVWESKAFSDNVLLAYALPHGIQEGVFGSLLAQVIEFQCRAALSGFFIRGGWSLGNLFANESGLFGGALLEAVELEKQAVFPRVVLSQVMKDEVVFRHMAGHASPAPHQYHLLVDGDGVLFTHYLGFLFSDGKEEWVNLGEHARRVEVGYDAAHDGKVRMKYDWLASYHNMFCDEQDPRLVRPEVRVSRKHSDYGIRRLRYEESPFVAKQAADLKARADRIRQQIDKARERS
jgi:hypothetical protein